MKKLISSLLIVSVMVGMMAVPALAVSSLGQDKEYYESNAMDGVFNTSTVTSDPVLQDPTTTNEVRRDKNASVEPPPAGFYGGYIDTGYNSPYYGNESQENLNHITNGNSETSVWNIIQDGAQGNTSSGNTSTSNAVTGNRETLVKYYNNGTIGSVSIPAIGLTANVYEGTTSSIMMNGWGHMTNTTAWDGNVVLAGHNRGAYVNVDGIRTLVNGDRVTYTTLYGVRTYEVYRVEKIYATDLSVTNDTYNSNMITLITCVAGQADTLRWVVQAREV